MSSAAANPRKDIFPLLEEGEGGGVRILFMGSPAFAETTLQTLISFSTVIGVVTQPPQPKGRGKTLSKTAVHLAAESHAIPVYTPKTKKRLSQIVQHLRPDFIVVVAYGRLLPAAITTDYCCINVHGSLLPAYRGASPIHAALLNGDAVTGITLIRMNDQMDAGDIVLLETTPIQEKDTFQSLHDRLATMGAAAVARFFSDPRGFLSHAKPQDSGLATYCQKIASSDAELRLSHTVLKNLGLIKAFSPSPGAYIIENGRRIKILQAIVQDGILCPVLVKPEGKKEMLYTDYVRGYGEISFFQKRG